MRLCPTDIFDIGEVSIQVGVYQQEENTINEKIYCSLH